MRFAAAVCTASRGLSGADPRPVSLGECLLRRLTRLVHIHHPSRARARLTTGPAVGARWPSSSSRIQGICMKLEPLDRRSSSPSLPSSQIPNRFRRLCKLWQLYLPGFSTRAEAAPQSSSSHQWRLKTAAKQQLRPWPRPATRQAPLSVSIVPSPSDTPWPTPHHHRRQVQATAGCRVQERAALLLPPYCAFANLLSFDPELTGAPVKYEDCPCRAIPHVHRATAANWPRSSKADHTPWPACLQTPRRGTQSFRTAPVSALVSWHPSHGLKFLVFEGITVWARLCYTWGSAPCSLRPPTVLSYWSTPSSWFLRFAICPKALCRDAASLVLAVSSERPQCYIACTTAIPPTDCCRHRIDNRGAHRCCHHGTGAHPLQPTYTSPCSPHTMQLVSQTRLL